MKVNKQLAVLAVALSTISASAVAAGNDNGFYIGGGLGYSGHDLGCPSKLDCSESDVGFKLLTGYQFNPNFALEASYNDLGKSKIHYGGSDNLNLGIKAQSFTVAALGIYPVSNSASLFAKVGAHASRTTVSVDVTANSETKSGSVSDNHAGLLLGIGGQYKFTENLIGRFEWEWLNQANRLRVYNLDAKGDINLVTASLLYKF